MPEPEPAPDGPVASILIAAYNAAAFLDGAIASALAQTCPVIEVVVVDDASSDGTHAALQAWARRDSRVRVLRHAQRSGAAAARNTAIDAARGRWLAVLDADDAFRPERIERLVAAAEREGADLFADNLRERDFATGAPLGTAFPPANGAPSETLGLADLLRRDRLDLPGHAKIGYLKPIVRRAFLERAGLERAGLRYRSGIRVGEDLLFYFECVAAGGRFRFAPGEALYLYSVRGGSESSRGTSAPHLSAATTSMRRIARRIGDADLAALLRQRQRVADSDAFDLAVETRRFGDAVRHARWADPARVVRRLGMAAGAVRRRLGGRVDPARNGNA